MSDNQKTPQEIAREILSKSKQKDAKAKVRLTRYIFLLLIVFQTLGVFVAFKTFPNASMTSFFIDFGLIGAYVVLFFTSYKLPFQSFLLGLGLYFALNLFLAMINIDYLLRGLVIKTIIFTSLSLGLHYAWQIKKIKTKSDLDMLDDIEAD
jgi:hypothetical protein